MKISEKYNILHNVLINLHTARWTMNEARVKQILDAIGSYSYAHTNSNGDYKQDSVNQCNALERLGKL